MSRLRFTKVAAPSTPAATKVEVYVDTADKRVKTIDDAGIISTLNNVGMGQLNLIYNGGLCIQQRVAIAATAIAGVSLTTRAGVVADRWAVTVGNVATPQWTQVNAGTTVEAGLSAKFYGRITQITNAAKFIFSQVLANEDIACYRGMKVRLSCKIKQFAGATAVYRLGLLSLGAAGTVDVIPAITSTFNGASTDPTWGANLTLITPDASPTGENGTITGNALSVTSTAAWVRSSAVFSVPAGALNLIPVLFRDTIGAASDSVGIAEIQLTQGPDISDFVELPRAWELARCQRYFAKTFAAATVPVTSAGINTGEAKGVAGKAGAVVNAGIIYWRFPVVMWRTPPTVIGFNPAAANAVQRNLTGAADMGATAFTAQLDSSVMSIATGVAATAVGDQIGLHITADAEFVT